MADIREIIDPIERKNFLIEKLKNDYEDKGYIFTYLYRKLENFSEEELTFVFQELTNKYGYTCNEVIDDLFFSEYGNPDDLIKGSNETLTLNESKRKILICLARTNEKYPQIIYNRLSNRYDFKEIAPLECYYKEIYTNLSEGGILFNSAGLEIENIFKDREDFKIYKNTLMVSMLLTNMLFNKLLNGKEISKSNSKKIIDAYNIVFPNEQINDINGINIKNLEYLFDFQIKNKFNQVGIDLGSLDRDSFLSILLSFSKTNKNNQTLGELLNDNEFKSKINKVNYKEINNEVKTQKELFDALGLTEKDFNQKEIPTYKVFYISHHIGHAITVVIDTSKPYEEAIKDIKSIAKIDSSKATESKDYSFGFFKEIPSANNESYQENNTCYINATCACSVILNNCQHFGDIVEKNGKLKTDIENKISEEISENYLKNAPKITDINNYVEVGKTKDGEIIKVNIESKDMIQRYDIFLQNIERLKLCENSLENIVEKYKEIGIELVIEVPLMYQEIPEKNYEQVEIFKTKETKNTNEEKELNKYKKLKKYISDITGHKPNKKYEELQIINKEETGINKGDVDMEYNRSKELNIPVVIGHTPNKMYEKYKKLRVINEEEINRGKITSFQPEDTMEYNRSKKIESEILQEKIIAMAEKSVRDAIENNKLSSKCFSEETGKTGHRVNGYNIQFKIDQKDKQTYSLEYDSDKNTFNVYEYNREEGKRVGERTTIANFDTDLLNSKLKDSGIDKLLKQYKSISSRYPL